MRVEPEGSMGSIALVSLRVTVDLAECMPAGIEGSVTQPKR